MPSRKRIRKNRGIPSAVLRAKGGEEKDVGQNFVNPQTFHNCVPCRNGFLTSNFVGAQKRKGSSKVVVLKPMADKGVTTAISKAV
ncbi:MAG: hypothetical protein N2116_05175 [Armatimonadetes bacterium]|nr:hypothetical protein [Armatimonadota bacterium]